ncbi:ribulose-phosphate 3-epimerase [Lactobacillus colini]|uniref:Ribulose-phosphate 3-epimerase n=1 Tax=Lactobacillus colini TaxID=1819254 RepID=A0ABS4MFJ1_9LACO|nr:ribulose-phosphate 3-epimerase [Lactobacillus colini]MBP2058460.1 ribulose-phosphate 3-epimerase [Lactobacillus colini]
MIIAPSILNADSLNLRYQIQEAVNAGIVRFHIDIMDGHFVPNLSFGPQLVSDFKRDFQNIKLEVHLMSNNPKDLVPMFVKSGADIIELHYESMSENKLKYWINYLKEKNVKVGLVLNPDTDINVVKKFSTQIDQVLVMSVYPGFGGQKFISESVVKIQKLKEILDDNIPIEVDGGINEETAKMVINVGATILVAGSFIFGSDNIRQQVNKLEEF